jgi:hypothetical protein
MSTNTDNAFREAFSAARQLEATEAEVAAVLRGAAPMHTARRRWWLPRSPLVIAPRGTLAAGLIVLLIGGSFAAPPTRAAMEDAFGAFSGWFGGDNADAPGRPLEPGDDVPSWLRDAANVEPGSQRIVAEEQGVRLYAHREAGHAASICFDLDTSVGLCDSPAGWGELFADHAVVVIGPGGGRPDLSGTRDAQGRRPLFGVTSGSVEYVELRYENGPALRADRLDGGFVLLADADRHPQVVLGFDRSGNELERVDVTYIDWDTP